MADNLKSLQGFECFVQEKNSKELREGRIRRPFSFPPLPAVQISLLGIFFKTAPGEYHLIYHLSYPRGGSVNNSILDE